MESKNEHGPEIGAKMAIKNRSKEEKIDASKIWRRIAASVDPSTETMDEDSLLEHDEILNNSTIRAPVCDTEVTVRKPCRNCTCGLAQKEMISSANQSILKDGPTSNCGSCYLGDAFRCSSCPYRGLPAFKLGEQVKVNMKDDLNDI